MQLLQELHYTAVKVRIINTIFLPFSSWFYDLRPAYRAIKHVIDINFYTFGKSESFIDENGETKFKCQHGESECNKNKLLTCGLHFIGDDKDRQVEFLTCTSSSSSSILYRTYSQCAEVSKLNWKEIESCAEGELGTELQLQMEKDSKVIKESGHVPTITFDGIYVARDFFAALSDFYGVVERKLGEIEKTEM